jgi:3-oxoacyl-[acyl-carrier-protein] synthase II
MQAFIRGIGIISPQKTFNTKDFLSEVVEYNSTCLTCIEPVYKEFLDPVMARRMGRIIKMGIAASHVCLKDAGIDMPDAIITGTALGCLEDTEKFLLSIIENDEQFLTPTSFILSTHNTVGAQIALQLKCMNYNFTYVHKGFSFESAVLDALMTIAEGNGNHILVGGHDEMTSKYFRVCDRVDYWKKEPLPNTSLKDSKSPGSIGGEGAAFFVLSNEESNRNYACLKGIRQIYKPGSPGNIEESITGLLEENQMTAADIDLVIYGMNGDSRFDDVYHQIRGNMFHDHAAAYYKHLCGEYQTSAGFAMWMAAMILKMQHIPDEILIGNKKDGGVKNIVIVNGFMGADYAVYLLSRC